MPGRGEPQRRRLVSAWILLSLLLGSLLGCVGHPPSDGEDLIAELPAGTYVVQPGDTLYSIAFRSGLDYRKVAAANGIVAPFTIYPGQRILLDEAVPSRLTTAAPPVPDPRPTMPTPLQASAPVYSSGQSAAYPPAPAPIARGTAEPIYTAPDKPIVNAPPSPPPVTAPIPTPAPAVAAVLAPAPAPALPTAPAPAPVGAPEPVPAPAPVTAPVATTAPIAIPGAAEVNKQEAATSNGDIAVWLWPTSGKVIRGYSESVHKGIDISGMRGDPVVAVAAGKVVYGGTGIVGFGELLIVKHNDEYLSAYGHNERLLVTEGQTVTAGQIIAEKGSSGTDSVKLHFEIRKEGKPIDPQRVLPPR